MDLPKVYQNTNISLETHDQNIFYSNKETPTPKHTDIKSRIDQIFTDKTFIYKAKVEIIIDNKTTLATIIGKTKEYLITMNNELIPINKIQDIKKLDNNLV